MQMLPYVHLHLKAPLGQTELLVITLATEHWGVLLTAYLKNTLIQWTNLYICMFIFTALYFSKYDCFANKTLCVFVWHGDLVKTLFCNWISLMEIRWRSVSQSTGMPLYIYLYHLPLMLFLPFSLDFLIIAHFVMHSVDIQDLSSLKSTFSWINMDIICCYAGFWHLSYGFSFLLIFVCLSQFVSWPHFYKRFAC